MAFVWFKKMATFPNQERLTKTACFTQGTALLVYGGAGLLLLCAPSLWSILLAFELRARVEGYMRLAGVNLIALSFIYIIVARAGSSTSKHGPTLSSILERAIFVNGVLVMFTVRGILPLYFALLFILLDTALAMITLGIWIKETPRACITLYFKEVFSCIQKRPSLNKTTISHVSIQIIGVLQLCGGATLLAVPWLTKDALKLDSFENHAEGFLACSFLLIAIHGWFHIMAGGAELAAFATAAVFYRLSLTIPLQCVLYLCDEIELYLFIFLGSCEFVFSLILLLLFLLENSKRKTRIQVFKSKREPLQERQSENVTADNIEDIAHDVTTV